MTAIVVFLSGWSGRAYRGLDGGELTGSDRRRTPGVPVDLFNGVACRAETKWRTDGGGFLVSRGMRTCSQGKKVVVDRCEMVIETKASLGHTECIEVCARRAPVSS